MLDRRHDKWKLARVPLLSVSLSKFIALYQVYEKMDYMKNKFIDLYQVHEKMNYMDNMQGYCLLVIDKLYKTQDRVTLSKIPNLNLISVLFLSSSTHRLMVSVVQSKYL